MHMHVHGHGAEFRHFSQGVANLNLCMFMSGLAMAAEELSELVVMRGVASSSVSHCLTETRVAMCGATAFTEVLPCLVFTEM